MKSKAPQRFEYEEIAEAWARAQFEDPPKAAVEAFIDEVFLEDLPDTIEEWLLTSDLDSEEKAEFMGLYRETAPLRLKSAPRNSRCPCGSGKQAKRCCLR